MFLFVPSLPIPANARTSRNPCNQCRPKSSRLSFAKCSASPNPEPASWQKEVRLLLDPSLNPGAKQVLLQDLAKRTPEILNDTCAKTCEAFNLSGVADVIRQMTDDVIPDLITNGPRYAAKAADNFPDNVSRMTRGSGISNMPPMPAPNAEEVAREVRNVFNRTPEGLFTPDYQVIKKASGYEIRQYPTLIVATTSMKPDADVGQVTEVGNAAAMGQSFNELAGYLFGKNEESTAMKMTTPVVLSKGASEETMSFIIGEYQNLDDVPQTLDADNVTLREEPGKLYAVSEFSGFVTQGEARRQREKLLSSLSHDGVDVDPEADDAYKCMIYNGPSTLPNLRRNEILIQVLPFASSEEHREQAEQSEQPDS